MEPPAPNTTKLLWVHKTATSSSLSHSSDSERLRVFSQAQRTSRLTKRAQRGNPKLAQSTDKKKKKPSQAFFQTKFMVAAYRRPSLRKALPLDPECTPDERRAMDFYRSKTVKKILTHQQDLKFWRDDVLSLTKLCPAFRHLIAAIGATHEVVLAQTAARLNVFALEQCNKAVKELREAPDIDPSVLVASCILISAYNILRCDLTNADRSIDAGLQIVSHHAIADSDSPYASPFWYVGDMTRLLSALNFRGGYKLWASDVAFQFEKVPLTDNPLIIEADHVHGPFLDFEQAVMCFKALATEAVAKIMRNLAVGAFVDPSSPVAQAMQRQLELFDTWWKMYYNTIDSKTVLEELEWQSLRVAYHDLYLLFHTRVICQDELEANRSAELFSIRQKILELGEEVISARHLGFTVTYMERFVNRSLWAVGLYSFDDGVRRRVAQLLRSQSQFSDGLNEWLRGTIISMFADLDQLLMTTDSGPNDNFLTRRATPVGYSCREADQTIVLTYLKRDRDGRVERKEYLHRWDQDINDTFTTADISAGLQVIMASYRMFGKPVLAEYPRGYVRPMYFHGELVPVFPESKQLFGSA